MDQLLKAEQPAEQQFKGAQKQSCLNRRSIWGGLKLGLISFSAAVLVILLAALFIFRNKYQQFLQAAELDHAQVMSLVKSKNEKTAASDQLTFLILGIDAVDNRQNGPQMTDTVMLARLHFDSAQINLVSLPRDLWSEPYKTKINALYQYGLEREPQNPTAYPQEIIAEMTGAQIDTTFVVKLDDVGALIDQIGGIQVNVEQGFADEKFPRNDVDIQTETDPAVLYETVVFEPGLQWMDGDTALKYIRSRQSEDLESGNDIARTERQQQVIQALLAQLSQPVRYWHNPAQAGYLYRFYADKFDQFLEIEALIQAGKNIGLNNLSNLNFSSTTLPVFEADDRTIYQGTATSEVDELNDLKKRETQGVIEHPKDLRPYQNLWVYVIRDQQEFENFVQNALNGLE